MTTSVNPPYKQLRRTTDDRIVAGVCGGLGRYFNVDPVLMRVLFAVIVVFTGGLALLAYPVLWFLMPEEPANASAWQTATRPWQAQNRGTNTYQPPAYTPPAEYTPPAGNEAPHAPEATPAHGDAGNPEQGTDPQKPTA